MNIRQSASGWSLITLLILLMVIGYLIYMMAGNTGGSGAGDKKVSRPKAIIDKAKEAASKADQRQADAERILKELEEGR